MLLELMWRRWMRSVWFRFGLVNFFVIMLTRYRSLSQQGHLQPHSKSKAWQLSTPL